MMQPNFTSALVNQLPIGVLWQQSEDNKQNTTFFANKAACHLLGLAPTDPQQQPAVLELEALKNVSVTQDHELSITGNERALCSNPMLEALRGVDTDRRDLLLNGKPIHLKTIVVNSASATSARHQVVLLQPRDHRLFIESAETGDMSSTELSLRDTLAFDKLISNVSSQLINADGSRIDQHIDEALAAIGQFGLADRCYVFQFNAPLDKMHNSHEWVRDGVTAHLDDLQQIREQDLPWFFAQMREQGLVAIHDVEVLPTPAEKEKALFRDEDIRSVICVGMQAGGKLVGFVGCDMVARHRHWSEADIRRLKLVGEIIAQALQSQQYLKTLSSMQRQLVEANQRLHQLVGEDSLTGLANRRQFDQQLDTEMRRLMRTAGRQQQPLSLMMIDIDHFKAFNDSYGHLQGDDALKTVGNLLREHFKRSGELVSRFGGEEFAVLLPGASKSQAVESGGHLLEKMEALGIVHSASETGKLSLSIGIACAPEDCHDEPFAVAEAMARHLLAHADAALYDAKASGRNCVVSAFLPAASQLNGVTDDQATDG